MPTIARSYPIEETGRIRFIFVAERPIEDSITVYVNDDKLHFIEIVRCARNICYCYFLCGRDCYEVQFKVDPALLNTVMAVRLRVARTDPMCRYKTVWETPTTMLPFTVETHYNCETTRYLPQTPSYWVRDT